ncbi:MAG: alkaline phosphatase D family protein, partial [Dehalococcoidia bacterium]|nr:alkaline phosphatase D family protein [Dehalococcoidia bacterium]
MRWAFFTGQDFPGRYYNSFAHLLNTYNTEQNDLDFLVHTGDYVYETAGDPVFQTRDHPRGLQFQDTAGAIELGEPGKEFFAAKSLSNYRDLYKTYRSDEMLQQLHERFPMIVIWDDHEYADDSWQDVATHFNGRVDEKDPTRKRDAERAFFEYIPIEIGLGANDELEIGEDILYPNSLVYRNFDFGANVDLIMTDYRTYRPDHLIPEDAFPGTIVMDEAPTESFLGAGKGIEPYINIDAPEFEALKTTMTQLMTSLYVTENEFFTQEQAQQKAAEVVTGNLSARYINEAFDTAGLDKPFDQAALAALPHGIAFLSMGKMEPYSRWGSRYVVNQDLYSVYATYLNSMDTNVDEAFGTTQENWFKGILDNSTATWKIFVSSVSAAPMMEDFSNPVVAALLPEGFPWHYRMQMKNDQWDGFPVKKQEMLNYLSTIPGAVIISGDIHASFVCDHGDRGVNRVYEFTCPSVSSGTIQEMSATHMADFSGLEDLPMSQLGFLFKLSSID